MKSIIWMVFHDSNGLKKRKNCVFWSIGMLVIFTKPCISELSDSISLWYYGFEMVSLFNSCWRSGFHNMLIISARGRVSYGIQALNCAGMSDYKHVSLWWGFCVKRSVIWRCVWLLISVLCFNKCFDYSKTLSITIWGIQFWFCWLKCGIQMPSFKLL